MQRIQQEETRRRNRAGGYWIAEADPGAAVQGLRRSWPAHALTGAVLATDGVSRDVDLHGTFPAWRAVADCAIERGPDAVLDAIRRDEAGDAEGRRWPRSKASDGQALIVVRFGPDPRSAV